LLQDVHSNIVQQKLARKHPLMNEGAGGADAGLPAFLLYRKLRKRKRRGKLRDENRTA